MLAAPRGRLVRRWMGWLRVFDVDSSFFFSPFFAMYEVGKAALVLVLSMAVVAWLVGVVVYVSP